VSHWDNKYIPALGHDFLTPLYDPLLRLFMREEEFKGRLVVQARIQEGDRVLDLGCGTGTLAVIIKQAQPGAAVVGLDGDAKVLEIAHDKAAKAGVELILDRGMSYELPYYDSSFDRVLSSLMLHHLSTADKKLTFNEVFRVLRPGGELHVVDFGPPRSTYSRLLTRITARSEQMAANIQGLLPEMFSEAGFAEVSETGQFMTIAGALSFYRAQRPL
jgi:ubiquinone/menaquinone biosynthesis C-methylase UbiE